MFQKWAVDGAHSGYRGIFETADHAPPGLYTLSVTSQGEPYCTMQKLRDDRILNFASGPLPRVMQEIQIFWDSKKHYQDLGVSHKRGILLHGPAGNGKTGIITAVIADAIARNGLAFQMTNIDHFKAGIPLLRQIEADRPVTVLLEDIEHIVKTKEEVLLEVMDGASSIGNGTLFVATTNKLGDIPDRIKWRPSRIDTLIEIGVPTPEQRVEYLKFLSPGMEELVDKTDDFTLAMLKELVIAIRIYQKTPEHALSTARKLGGKQKGN